MIEYKQPKEKLKSWTCKGCINTVEMLDGEGD